MALDEVNIDQSHTSITIRLGFHNFTDCHGTGGSESGEVHCVSIVSGIVSLIESQY